MTTACTVAHDAEANALDQPEVLAGLRERLAAALLDVLLFATVGLVAALLLRSSVDARRGMEAMGGGSGHFPWPLLAFVLGVFSVLTFACEWLVHATPGKLLCRLRVKALPSTSPGFLGAMVRMILRPVDLVLGPVLILMSPGRQRLGDRIAGTVVVLAGRNIENVAEDFPVLATWEERARAAIADASLLILISVVYLVTGGSISPSWPLQMAVQPLQLSLLAMLWWWYFLLGEGLLGGTVGKRVCALQVVSMRPGQPRFVGSVLRSLCYPLNLATFEIVPFLLIRCTRRRQNVGDMLANSVVCRIPRR